MSQGKEACNCIVSVCAIQLKPPPKTVGILLSLNFIFHPPRKLVVESFATCMLIL